MNTEDLEWLERCRRTNRIVDELMRAYDAALARAEAAEVDAVDWKQSSRDWKYRADAAEAGLADAKSLLRDTYSGLQLKGTNLGARYDAFLSRASVCHNCGDSEGESCCDAVPAPAAESEPDRVLDACDEAERYCAAADQADDERIADLEALFQQTHGCHWSWVAKEQEQRLRIADLERELAAALEECKTRAQRCDNWAADCSDLRTDNAALRAAIDAAVGELRAWIKQGGSGVHGAFLLLRAAQKAAK